MLMQDQKPIAIQAEVEQDPKEQSEGGQVEVVPTVIQRAVFKQLEELNFSFNLVEDEEGLIYPVAQFPRLICLIVTGNPFSLRGDPFSTHALENVINQKTLGSGRIVNETLNPPTYLRR
jgi:hypothetical protein